MIFINHKTKIIKIVYLWILFTTICLFQPFNIYASIIFPPQWYITRTTFDTSSLPSGIEIIEIDPTFETYALINRNQEPLYVVKENKNDWRTFPNSELPNNYEPLFKLVNNQSFFYFDGELNVSFTDKRIKPLIVGYNLNSLDIKNSAARSVKIDDRIYTLVGESRQVYSFDRPAQVDIPTPQPLRILCYYKGEPLEISGTLIYSLNGGNDSNTPEKEFKATSGWNKFLNSLLWILVSFFLIYFCFSLIVYLIKLVSSRNNQEKKSVIIKRLKKNTWLLIITIVILCLLRLISVIFSPVIL